jgi:hypothetical protein
METEIMSSISSIQQLLIDHLSWVVPGALANIQHEKAMVSTFKEEAMTISGYTVLFYVVINNFNAILDTMSFNTHNVPEGESELE